jgi:hypothetical protein
MKLTDDIKCRIDAMSYDQLLHGWRFAPIGDPMMQDESGDYWAQRIKETRARPGGDEAHVRASKAVGWAP